ncbi:MAG: hypothetical protein ACLTLY_06010 [Agathobacter rectalis]
MTRFDIVGADRSIRTDEWAVQVPTFFHSITMIMDVTSNRTSVGDENMILDYFAPGKNVSSHLGKALKLGIYFVWKREWG